MKHLHPFLAILATLFLASCGHSEKNNPNPALTNDPDAPIQLYPRHKAREINPDTHLTITFPSTPMIGKKGMIRIYDATSGRLTDSLDLSIPAGPTTPQDRSQAIYSPEPYIYHPATARNWNTKPGTPSGLADRTLDTCQLTIIGGFTDAFHFFPIIVHGRTATIYLHNNMLDYGSKYYVTMDDGVLTTDQTISKTDFHGFTKEDPWRFSTKKKAPKEGSTHITVAADGSEDFSTIQGALDFVPEDNPERVTIFVKDGDYEEIVYFRNKKNLTIEGESKEGVVVHYYNCEVFNPHPHNIKTNEKRGTFPYRRAAFAADNVQNLELKNMTIMTTAHGQAEGLFLMGERILCQNIHIVGDGDALQANGSAVFIGCSIDGGGDTILGRGTLFFKDCHFVNHGGPFMWVRNGRECHGNIFVDCWFEGRGQQPSDLARCPLNRGPGYPYSEAVFINCRMKNISAEAFASLEGDTSNMRYWEYASTDFEGAPLDFTGRNPASRRLDAVADSAIIRDYQDTHFIFTARD